MNLGASRLSPHQSVLSQVLSSSPPYASESLLTQAPLNPLLTARQPQLSTLDQLVGLGGPLRPDGATSLAGLGQATAPQQVTFTAEQVLALRLLREQEQRRRALSGAAVVRGSSSSPPRGPFLR
jgi:hypothetical protein